MFFFKYVSIKFTSVTNCKGKTIIFKQVSQRLLPHLLLVREND